MDDDDPFGTARRAANNENNNVIMLGVETTLDLPLDRVLDGARDRGLTDALVLGYDAEGMFFMSSQTCDAGKILILMERARWLLIERLRNG